jgi:integrase
MKAPDPERTAWLLDAATGARLRIPILLAITTGMRRGEILALRWQDIDFDAGLLRVQRSLQETKAGVLTFKVPKSRRGLRPITLGGIAVEMLREQRDRQGRLRVQLGEAYENNDLVCCREDGTIWPPSAFTSAYRDLLRRRGIENTRFHDLRHGHASQLIRDGISPKLVSERLGHSKVSFTLETYSHVLPGMQEEAAKKADLALRTALEKQRRPLA